MSYATEKGLRLLKRLRPYLDDDDFRRLVKEIGLGEAGGYTEQDVDVCSEKYDNPEMALNDLFRFAECRCISEERIHDIWVNLPASFIDVLEWRLRRV